MWQQVNPELLEPGSLALADLAVRCPTCGEPVMLRETFSPGTLSGADGLGEGMCGRCEERLRVRVVVERRGL